MAVSLEKIQKTLDLSGYTISTTPYITGGLNITGSGTYNYDSSWVNASSPSNKEIMERIEGIEERLVILKVDKTLHEKYPSLREAYEHYKTIEALVKNGPNQSD